MEKTFGNTGIPGFIALCFIASQVLPFYKLNVRLSAGKKMTTGFIVVLALFRWPETKPAMSSRYACNYGSWVITTGKKKLQAMLWLKRKKPTTSYFVYNLPPITM